MQSMSTEPVRIVGEVATAIGVVFTAFILMGLSFGWFYWTPEQTTLVTGLYAAVSAVVVMLYTRGKVSPPATVEKEQINSFEEGAAKTEADIKLDPDNDYGDYDDSNGELVDGEDVEETEYLDEGDVDVEEDYVESNPA